MAGVEVEEAGQAALLAFVREYDENDPSRPMALDAFSVDQSIPAHGDIEAALDQIMASLDAQDGPTG